MFGCRVEGFGLVALGQRFSRFRGKGATFTVFASRVEGSGFRVQDWGVYGFKTAP